MHRGWRSVQRSQGTGPGALLTWGEEHGRSLVFERDRTVYVSLHVSDVRIDKHWQDDRSSRLRIGAGRGGKDERRSSGSERVTRADLRGVFWKSRKRAPSHHVSGKKNHLCIPSTRACPGSTDRDIGFLEGAEADVVERRVGVDASMPSCHFGQPQTSNSARAE